MTADPVRNPLRDFDGLIDDVRLYDYVRTAEQVRYNYATEVEYFDYDFLDRLTEVAGLYSSVFSYDGLDNITEKGGNTYLYQDSAHVHAVTTAGSNSYTYDANGNMTSRPIYSHAEPVEATLVWNEENLLNEIEEATTPYDTIESGACPARRRRIYDGDPFDRLTAGKQRAIKTDASGSVTLGACPTRRRRMNNWCKVRLDSSSDVDEEMVHYWLGGQLVATREGGGLQEIHPERSRRTQIDHLGSSLVAIDLSGAAVAGSAYYPYGEHRSSTGAFGTDRDFTGQYLDSGTGLHFYNARYYDSALGRFVSPDSTVPDWHEPANLNLYAYVYNNPVRYTDPTGHCIFGFCRKAREWVREKADRHIVRPIAKKHRPSHNETFQTNFWGLDFQAMLGVVSLSVELGVVVDSSGNYGTQTSVGGGAALGAGYSVNPENERSTATSIDELGGVGAEMGAELARLSGEFVTGNQTHTGYGYSGLGPSSNFPLAPGGPTPSGGIYVEVEYTWVGNWGDLDQTVSKTMLQRHLNAIEEGY